MNSKEEKYGSLFDKCMHMFEQSKSFTEIENYLSSNSNDLEINSKIIKELKILHFWKRRKRGTLIILLGAVLLLLGFVMTILNFYSNSSIAYVMYGFTSLGLLVIFIGLYEIFG